MAAIATRRRSSFRRSSRRGSSRARWTPPRPAVRPLFPRRPNADSRLRVPLHPFIPSTRNRTMSLRKKILIGIGVEVLVVVAVAANTFLGMQTEGLSAAELSAAPKVGSPAPLFTAVDTRGTSHSLESYRGKWVVLEWFNHGCPYSKKHYKSV